MRNMSEDDSVSRKASDFHKLQLPSTSDFSAEGSSSTHSYLIEVLANSVPELRGGPLICYVVKLSRKSCPFTAVTRFKSRRGRQTISFPPYLEVSGLGSC